MLRVIPTQKKVLPSAIAKIVAPKNRTRFATQKIVQSQQQGICRFKKKRTKNKPMIPK
jgi:hypothetical protein